jgi:hypothetical protein
LQPSQLWQPSRGVRREGIELQMPDGDASLRRSRFSTARHLRKGGRVLLLVSRQAQQCAALRPERHGNITHWALWWVDSRPHPGLLRPKLPVHQGALATFSSMRYRSDTFNLRDRIALLPPRPSAERLSGLTAWYACDGFDDALSMFRCASPCLRRMLKKRSLKFAQEFGRGRRGR